MSDGYQTCGPEPEDFSPRNACEIFVGLFNAYLALQTGQTRVLVKILDRETRFKAGDLAQIEKNLYRFARMAVRQDPKCAQQVGAVEWLQNPRAGSMRLQASTPANVPFNTVPTRPFGRSFR